MALAIPSSKVAATPRQDPECAVHARHLEPDDAIPGHIADDARHVPEELVLDAHGGSEDANETLWRSHERLPRARSSWAFVIFERPRMFRRRASS